MSPFWVLSITGVKKTQPLPVREKPMVEPTRTVLSDITGAAPEVTEPHLGESGNPKTAYGEAQKWKGVVFPGNCSKPSHRQCGRGDFLCVDSL